MRLFFLLVSILFLTFCTTQKEEFSISYEKYTLSNGLDVILHQDAIRSLQINSSETILYCIPVKIHIADAKTDLNGIITREGIDLA